MDKRLQALLLPKLQSAINYTYSRFPLKSSNKYYPNLQQLAMRSPGKINLYNEKMLHFKADQIIKYRQSAKINNRFEPGHISSLVESDFKKGIPRAGNCGELSIFAFNFLVKRIPSLEALTGTSIVILLGQLLAPEEHCLVLVGSPPADGNTHLITNTLVCDPWAKIASPMANYPLEWKMKMHKWSNRGLKGNFEGEEYDFFYDDIQRNAIRDGRLTITHTSTHGEISKFPSRRIYSLMDRNIFSI